MLDMRFKLFLIMNLFLTIKLGTEQDHSLYDLGAGGGFQTRPETSVDFVG